VIWSDLGSHLANILGFLVVELAYFRTLDKNHLNDYEIGMYAHDFVIIF